MPTRNQYSPYMIDAVSHCSPIGLLAGKMEFAAAIGIRRLGSAQVLYNTSAAQMCLVRASDSNEGRKCGPEPGSERRRKTYLSRVLFPSRSME